MKTIFGIIATVLIVGTLMGDNFGFTPITGAESVGYNAWALIVYVGGSWLVYRAFKKDKPTENNQPK